MHIVSHNNHLIALALTLAVVLSVALACAPVAGSAVISVGTDVGNRSPDFTMQLADGSQVTSQFLDDQDHAALLFYFATWWPECRAELQTLDTLATEYDNIDFYVVSYNEDVAIVNDYINERTYTDLIPVQPASPMVADFEITRQMAMVAVNANGIIYHRQVMGRAEEWVPYFQEMQANPKVIPASLEAELQKEQRRKDIQLPSWWG